MVLMLTIAVVVPIAASAVAVLLTRTEPIERSAPAVADQRTGAVDDRG